MADATAGTSAAQLAAGNAQTYMNNARQYASQASNAAATASHAANSATQAASALTQQLAQVMALLSGSNIELTKIEDNDTVGIAREGQFFSAKYKTLNALFRNDLLQGEQNLADVSDKTQALANLNGVPMNAIKSALISNTSDGVTVSTSFSFKPGADGLLTVLSQGGSAGTNAPSVSLDVQAQNYQGCTLVNSQCNTSGSYNLAVFTAQFTVSKDVPVSVTITQTAPEGSTTSNLSSFFIYLPG